MESAAAALHLLPVNSALDTMNAEQQQYLKLEDLHTTASPSPDFDNNDASSQSPDSRHPSISTVYVTSKPAKKRKSWGQELPEPKTALPPRKRAKTDDEKEQRRIERIKRNRAAAHNSRERKRQETDTLAVENAELKAELEAYRRIMGPLPPGVVLPQVKLVADYANTPATSLVDTYGTADAAPSPTCPDDDDLFDSSIKQEPVDTPFATSLPPIFENLGVPPSPLSPLDPTQHSAVSVEQQSEQRRIALQHHHQPHEDDNPLSLSDVNFSQFLGFNLDSANPSNHQRPTPDLLQDPLAGPMDLVAFSNGAFDASFNPPLDFSFDDFIDDTATVAVDGLGAA